MAEASHRQDGYLPIGSYALIGDCLSAALVGRDGSIDWCCLPRFDSPSVFGRILDSQKGGHWQISPRAPFQSGQRYRDRSNLITTIFATATGRVQVTDFMPIAMGTVAHYATDDPSPRIVRLVECLAGQVTLDNEMAPMPDYARAKACFRAEGPRFHGDVDGRHFCILFTDEVPGANHSFTLEAGETVAFSLFCQRGGGCPNASETAWTLARARHLLRETQQYWWRWIAQVSYQGPYAEPVWRSALALKLMAYAPTGALIAAPTASLPEALGGQRNWDYRFTWLRDASFTLFALFQLGLYGEARDFFDWVSGIGIGDGDQVRNLYRVDGDPDTTEQILGHLTGYRGSSPVRIGNAASDQLQLDVYGELIDSAYLYARFGGEVTPLLWQGLRRVVDLAIELWPRPDASIWESRGQELDYTYSKMMCWVAIDRGLRLAERYKLPHDRDRWLAARRAIHRRVIADGYNQTLGSFTQALKGNTLDAAVLRVSQVRFLKDQDARVVSTVRTITERLAAGVLVSRYRTDQTDDGIDQEEEGAFLMCSFWLVDALAHIGAVEEAQRCFERLLSFASPVGLMAEEVDLRSGELLGNYPQAFTHLALIGAAVNIERARQGRIGAKRVAHGLRI